MSGNIGNLSDALSASSGINATKALSFQLNTEFEWIEAPITSFGYIWANDYTYHPLLNNTNYEIAYNLYNIEKQNLSVDEKQKYNAKVKKIVTEAPYIKAMSWFYCLMILTIILLIIKFISGVNMNIVLLITGGIALISLLYAMIFAKGVGDNTWIEFIAKYNASSGAGANSEAILKSFKGDDDRVEMMTQMKYSNNRNNSGSDGFLGALIGSLAGSYLKK
jgi:hypothetical protein